MSDESKIIIDWLCDMASGAAIIALILYVIYKIGSHFPKKHEDDEEY